MIFSKIKSLFLKKKVVVTADNEIFLDFGNNEIKAISKNNRFKVKSCSRSVNANTIISQPNAININGIWYMIGEAKTPINSKDRKIERNDIIQLISYTIANLDKKERFKEAEGIVNIDLYMLLPLNQLNDERAFRSLLERELLEVELNGSIKRKYSINLIRCFAEGSLVLNALEENMVNKVVIDIGGGTTEAFGFDEYNNDINRISINQGMRNLMPYYAAAFNKNGSNVINKLLREEYKFNQDQLKKKEEIDFNFLNELLEDIKLSILDYENEQNTNIIFVGGGSLAMKNNLIKWFNQNTEFKKLTFIDEPVFANVIGMQKFVSKNKLKIFEYYQNIKNCKIEKLQNEEMQEVEKVETLEVAKKTPNKENTALQQYNEVVKMKKSEKMKICKNLFESGLQTVKDISCKSGINDSSVRRYLKEMKLI